MGKSSGTSNSCYSAPMTWKVKTCPHHTALQLWKQDWLFLETNHETWHTEISSSAFLFLGSTFVFQETNCVCGHFQFPSHLGSYISSARADPVCAVFLYVLTMVWLLRLGIFDTHAEILMYATAHGVCVNITAESALQVDWKKNPLLH